LEHDLFPKTGIHFRDHALVDDEILLASDEAFLVSGATYDVSGESSANSTAAQETGDVANRQRQ
jgi:hypothetical protein